MNKKIFEEFMVRQRMIWQTWEQRQNTKFNMSTAIEWLYKDFWIVVLFIVDALMELLKENVKE